MSALTGGADLFDHRFMQVITISALLLAQLAPATPRGCMVELTQ